MLNYWKNILAFFRHAKISIRFSIVLFFITLIAFVSIAIMAVDQDTFNRILIRYAKDLIQKANSYIQSQISDYLRPLNYDINVNANLIKLNIIEPAPTYKFMLYLQNIIGNIPYLFSIYWSTPEGNVYGIKRKSMDTFSIEGVERKNQQTIYYSGEINKKGQWHQTKTTAIIKYDPRRRPWYTAAVEKKGLIWTSTYRFLSTILHTNGKNSPFYGITAALPIYDNAKNLRGVLAMDLTANELSRFIEKIDLTKNSIIFITDHNDRLVALSNVMDTENFVGKKITPALLNQLKIPYPPNGFFQYERLDGQIFTYNYQHRSYFLVRQILLNASGDHWHATIIVPVKDVLSPLKHLIFIASFLIAAVLLLGIVIAGFIARMIAKPIIHLVDEAQAIQKLQLDQPVSIRTRIKEIDIAANAFAAMKSGLKSFQSYVPKALVEKLFISGEIAHVGGEIKMLTLLFSDIQDFTKLSEKTPTTKFIYYLSEYFEEMTRVILHAQGTVDKYIGDNIMAFWGGATERQETCLSRLSIGITNDGDS